MLVGHTPGDSPIFSDYGDKPRRKTKRNKNYRIKCSCGARTTKNQAKLNGGLCHQCKKPLSTERST